MRLDFDQALKYGLIGEELVIQWLRSHDWCVLPAYVTPPGWTKGPRLYTPSEEIIAPDLFLFNLEKHQACWVDVKRKKIFSKHNISGDWNTGINWYHYCNYKLVEQVSGWPVWLLFLQEPQEDEGAPAAGLYGASLLALSKNIHHKWEIGEETRMVYWAPSALKFLASIEELKANFDCELSEFNPIEFEESLEARVEALEMKNRALERKLEQRGMQMMQALVWWKDRKKAQNRASSNGLWLPFHPTDEQ